MRKVVYTASAVILGVLCILCAVSLLKGRNSVPETEQAVRETVSATYQPVELTAEAKEVEEAEETEEAETPYVSPIDFAALQAVNPEIYAWLYIPNTDINYPLLQHDGDDAYYLTHDSEGNYSSGGAIFTEKTYSSKEFTEPVTVVYGHQMRSGTMFGRLQSTYSDPNGLANCSEIVVYLPERELHYTVCAAVPYDNRHILYNYNFESKRKYNAFLDSIYSVREIGAVFNDEMTISTDDQLLILSTCLYGNSQKRYLVLAKCVEDI